MSPVEIKKMPCLPVEFKGQGPHHTPTSVIGTSMRVTFLSVQLGLLFEFKAFPDYLVNWKFYATCADLFCSLYLAHFSLNTV